MAIDTAAKRYTISNVSCPWRQIQPPPTGATSGDERVAYGLWYFKGGATPVLAEILTDILSIMMSSADSEAILQSWAGSQSILQSASDSLER